MPSPTDGVAPVSDAAPAALPHSGQVSLTRLLAALHAQSQDGAGSLLDLRVVAIKEQQQDAWFIFAGELRLADGTLNHEQPMVIPAGPIRLVRYQERVEAIATEAELWRFARRWYEAITSQPDTAEAQPTSSIERVGSHADLGDLPGWRFTLYALGAGAGGSSGPRGPFFSRPHKFFAATLGDAAAQWLERPSLRRLSSTQFHLSVVLADRRACIGHIAVSDEDVAISLSGTLPREAISVAVLLTHTDGTKHQVVVDAPDQTIHVRRSESDIRGLQVHVLSEDGECLDEFFEDEHRCTRAQRVLGRAMLRGPQDLQLAMEQGEGETIEFKAMIPTGREDPKSRELLEVACAFANTRGGHLFIGVTDNLEIKGLERYLDRTGKGDTANARDKYAGAIRRMIREGLTPSVDAGVNWINLAGHHVLHVAIAGNPTGRHALVESGDIYVRRGASCAKARPSDLEIKFGQGAGNLLGELRRRR